MVTLTGAGGCGKSRLALRVASELTSRFSHGVWLVELAGIERPADIVPTIRRALGVGEGGDTGALATDLRNRSVLIVLDNCEHLIESCAALVGVIAEASPRVSVLATSRESLGIPGEAVYRVPSLRLPAAEASVEDIVASEAVRLFVERVQLRKAGFALDALDDAVAAGEICRRLDGIPLAIELAASRARTMPLPQLRDRLDDRFRLLTGGPRTAVPRQQTLLATVGWSFNLLSQPERDLLVRLAVFHGSADIAAITGICAGHDVAPDDIADLVASLEDKALIVPVTALDGDRFRLPETIRQFAAERLASADEAAELRDSHAKWFVALGKELSAGPPPGSFDNWLRALEDETDNIVAALRWLLPATPTDVLEVLLDLAAASEMTSRTIWRFPLVLEVVRLAEHQLDPATRARALATVASAIALGDLDADLNATELHDRALAIVDDPRTTRPLDARALLLFYRVLAGYLDPFTADEARTAVREADMTGTMLSRYYVRTVLSLVSPFNVTAPLLREASAIALEEGHTFLQASAQARLSSGLAFAGHSDEALSIGRAAVGPMLAARGILGQETMMEVALVEAEHGDLDRGLELAEEAVRRIPTTASSSPERDVANAYLAWIRLLSGNVDGAEHALHSIQRALGLRTFSNALRTVVSSTLARRRNNLDQAVDALVAVQLPARSNTSSDGWIRVVEEAAEVAEAMAEVPLAANLLHIATLARATRQQPASPRRRAQLERLRSSLDVVPAPEGSLSVPQIVATLRACQQKTASCGH